MRNLLLGSLAVVYLFSPRVAGQHVPNLTGTWVMDTTRSTSEVGGDVVLHWVD
jgi:hypothetical protein